MSEVLGKNPSLLLKLAANSLALSTSVIRFVAYYNEISMSKKQDKEYYEYLKTSYAETSEEDEYFAELFTDVSAEADRLLLELKAPDGK